MMITRSTTMKDNTQTKPKYFRLNPSILSLSRSYVGKPKAAKEPDPIIHSLKPSKFAIPKDVSVIEIMQAMKASKSLRLSSTSLRLTPSEKSERRGFIEKMKLFIVCENFPYAIVSHSIYLMDLLFSQKYSLPIEHMFIGSMLLAIKYYSIDTRLLLLRRVRNFMKDTSGVVYSIEELNQIEINCLMLLGYKLNWIHAGHFIQLLLLNGILFNTDMSNKSNSFNSNIYDLIYTIMDTLYEGEQYFSQDAFHLACACVAVGREICGFVPWASILEKVFGVSFVQFEYSFGFVKECYTGRKQGQSPQKPNYEKKPITTTAKPRRDDEFSSQMMLRSENKESRQKGVYYKSKSLEINKDQLEDFIHTQRTMCCKPNQLRKIKENDINSTKDNSFGMVDMNPNRTVAAYYNNEIKAYNNNRGRPGVISLNSSTNVVKKLDFNKIGEISAKKAPIPESEASVATTIRKHSESMRIEEEGKKPTPISLVKHMHTKSIAEASDKSYLTGIKRLLRENKNTKLFDNFEAAKRNNKSLCGQSQK